MSLDTKIFDVVGSGYVSEHHADERQRTILESERRAKGGAIVWLAFYAIAIVVVVVTNFQKTAEVVAGN